MSSDYVRKFDEWYQKTTPANFSKYLLETHPITSENENSNKNSFWLPHLWNLKINKDRGIPWGSEIPKHRGVYLLEGHKDGNS